MHDSIPEKQRRIELFSGQAEVWRFRHQQDRHGDGQRSPLQVPLPQPALAIQEQETVGSTPVFWKDEQLSADERPAILPMIAQ